MSFIRETEEGLEEWLLLGFHQRGQTCGFLCNDNPPPDSSHKESLDCLPCITPDGCRNGSVVGDTRRSGVSRQLAYLDTLGTGLGPDRDRLTTVLTIASDLSCYRYRLRAYHKRILVLELLLPPVSPTPQDYGCPC